MSLSKPVDISESRSCFGSENIRYESSFQYRGIAIIATFGSFDNRDSVCWIEKDRELLVDGFKKLQYGVVVWKDIMTKERFFQRLERVSDDHELHEKCESFALAIVTHGGNNGKLHAYDKEFRREDVYNFFKAGNCRGLENKLKLFIFHACRGDIRSKGVHFSGHVRRNQIQTARLGDYVDKDYLILCSTTEDNVAFGPSLQGSGFIICLNYVMKTEAGKPEGERQHMLDLLHDVINYTAGLNFGIYKQQPVLMYSLDQFYHLKEKEAIPQDSLQKHQYQTG